MSTALELVYQYRFLRGKCEAGRGLNVDEIDALAAIEALFSSRLDPAEPYFEGRQHAREKADLAAQLRNRTLADKVRIVELSPSGMVVAQAPFVDEGVTLEIVIDDREVSLSYRFRARVAWRRDDGDEDYVLGLELLGTPVLMRFRASTDDGEQQHAFDAATTDKFDKVAA